MQVTLESLELAALLELVKLASPRMSTAEALFFDMLLSRMSSELGTQLQAQQAQSEQPAPETPSVDGMHPV